MSAFVGLYLVGVFLPPGFDWVNFFSIDRYPPFWPPWTKPIVDLLNYPAIFALTVLAIGIRAMKSQSKGKKRASVLGLFLAVLLALLSLPTLWVLFMGNLDGLVLVGLAILPWGAPLALIKPQVSAFAFLAKSSSIASGVIWMLFSFIVWELCR